ncbi:MAG TPA: hypothetical protein VFX12_10700 [Vicinamibacterales bacterium]|nr:hypothetical protein [Vicinamibacterales bacterium]
MNDGSIIAAVITVHISTNDPAADGHVCPGIRIHIIDSLQPPGIGMPAMEADAVHQPIVAAQLPARTSADTPTSAG